uniref:(California timema) hypothetical protein n=1 Tax=Timema californicum TaxID=61474 RepID=A0A7R9P5T9_TIMCA|nr:unnamed protein product [Timema californicum]
MERKQGVVWVHSSTQEDASLLDVTIVLAKNCPESSYELYEISQDGDKFWRMPECYIRGSTIKYLRIPDEVIDMVKEETIVKSRGRGEMKGRGGGQARGRGVGREVNLGIDSPIACRKPCHHWITKNPHPPCLHQLPSWRGPGTCS